MHGGTRINYKNHVTHTHNPFFFFFFEKNLTVTHPSLIYNMEIRSYPEPILSSISS